MTTSERQPLEFYLKQSYPVTLTADPSGGFVAEIRDLPGCLTQGEDLEEAMEMAKEAKELWLEVAYERGDNIPLPSTKEEVQIRRPMLTDESRI